MRATDEAANTDPSPAARSFTVDTAPPETQIDSGPTGLTNDASPSFAFSSEAGATFECQLDGGGYAACASPFGTGPLADGPHAFEVRATDEAANTDPSPAARSFTVDTAPPETQIDSGPTGLTNDASPSFTFSSEAGATFECQLDGGGYAACASPFGAGPLADGPHAFEVRATDEAANTDPSPAARSFIVDTAPPETQIDSGPTGLTNDASPSFTFSSEAGATFECQLDGGGYATCASPFGVGPLADGPHAFEVRATDESANTDPSPAARSFIVDTAPPETQIDSGPAGPTNVDTSFTADTQPLQVRLSRKRKPKAGEPIAVAVSCTEDCVVVANGNVVVWGRANRHAGASSTRHRKKARFGLRKATRRLIGDQSATLRLRPRSKKARHRLMRLVRKGRKARAAVRVRYWDRVGNSSTARLTIRLLRR